MYGNICTFDNFITVCRVENSLLKKILQLSPPTPQKNIAFPVPLPTSLKQSMKISMETFYVFF